MTTKGTTFKQQKVLVRQFFPVEGVRLPPFPPRAPHIVAIQEGNSLRLTLPNGTHQVWDAAMFREVVELFDQSGRSSSETLAQLRVWAVKLKVEEDYEVTRRRENRGTMQEAL